MGLPAGAAIFEKALMAEYPKASFTLFEKQSDVLEELEKTASRYLRDYVIRDEDIDKFVLDWKGGEKFDVCWLDYCGPITMSRLKTLRRCISQRPENGIVAVTFMAGREKATANTILDLFDDNFSGLGFSVVDEKLVPAYFLRRTGAIVETVFSIDPNMTIKVFPYKDGVPMMTLVFKNREGARSTVEIEPYLK
jgi:hypothetical protein